MVPSSSDAPLVSSAYRPLPEGPSPRWRRSAEGLRWMRLAMFGSLASHAVATVLRLVHGVTWPPATASASLVPIYFFSAFDLITNVGIGLGLWRFGGLPASTGAARPARESFAFFSAAMAFSSLGTWLFAALARPLATGSFLLIGGISLAQQLALIALQGAYLGLLVRALRAALRSLGEAPPAWAPQAVAAYIGWRLFSIPLSSVVMVLTRGAPRVVWLLAFAATGAFTLALTSVLRRTEVTLARQESPESGLR